MKIRLFWIVPILALVFGLAPLGAQDAKFDQFIHQPNTFSSTQTFNNVVINGTCTGCTSAGTVTTTGSPANTQLAYFSGGATITSNSGVTFDGTSLVFPDPTTTAEGATKNYIDTQLANLSLGSGGSGASQNSYLVSGGQVTGSPSSLTLTASASTYYLNGVLTSSAQQTVTLATADPTNPRFDLVALNASGTLVAITGAPAASPSEPSYDPSVDLPLVFVSVPANATSPPNVVNTLLYQSDVGSPTEWNASVSGTGIVATSTNNPLSPGTHTIEATAMANNAYALLQIGSGSITPYTQNFFIFWIQSKATWAKNRTIVVQFLSSGVLVGNQITIQTGAFGFNSSTTGSYQQIAIPITSFAVNATQTINQVKFLDQGGAIGFYIGLVQFQGGVVGVASTALTLNQANAIFTPLTASLVSTTSIATMPNSSNLGALATGALIGTVSAGTSTLSAYAAHTCTNQVVTVLSAVLVPTCTTITSSYVNNSIALTGTDINTSNQVTVTHLAAALPVAQGGTNCTSASITCFNNITGFTAAGTTGTTSTNLVFSTSPTLITPALGTPTALTVNSTTTGTATIPVEFNLPTGISQAGTATATCSLPSSGAPTATAAGSSTPLVGDLAFSGSALNTWECHFTLPHDWAGSSLFDVRFVWRAASTSGNVVWQAKFLVVPAASLLSGSYSAASTVTSAAQGTTLQLQTAAITGVTVAAAAVDSEFFIQVSRNGGSGSDTMTGTAELISARVILRRAVTWGG